MALEVGAADMAGSVKFTEPVKYSTVPPPAARNTPKSPAGNTGVPELAEIRSLPVLPGSTEPKLFPQIDYIELDGQNVIRVSIEESPLKPHLAYGRAFKRIGSTNQKVDQAQYEYMLSQRNNGYGFDFQIC